MDKKELQNLIDRISLTGPEGIKKIKKVLKQFSENDDETAKAVEELIGKVAKAVSTEQQTFTDTQKETACKNIGALGESDEYVIAHALNDLNARLEMIAQAVAQHEHIIIKPRCGNSITNDYYAQGEILKSISHNTVYDILLYNPFFDRYFNSISRIILCSEYKNKTYSRYELTVGGGGSTTKVIYIYNTVEQLRVLALLQSEAGVTERLPYLGEDEGDEGYLVLRAETEEWFICVENKKVLLSIDGETDRISGLVISDVSIQEDENLVEISENDLSVLVGVSI